MAGKQKYYVVWVGRRPGIYTTWEDCRAQVHGMKGARYKSFATREEAEEAFSVMPERPVVTSRRSGRTGSPSVATSRRIKRANTPTVAPVRREDTTLLLPREVKARAIAVDAACSGNPGPMEYRGVCLATGEEVFRFGPTYGTNNIGEFLAIVHGLALIKQQNLTDMTLYSDSRNALLWVRQKKCKTKLARTSRTEELYQLIGRAEKWLKEHQWTTPVVKWETEAWGEIPADFGRK